MTSSFLKDERKKVLIKRGFILFLVLALGGLGIYGAYKYSEKKKRDAVNGTSKKGSKTNIPPRRTTNSRNGHTIRRKTDILRKLLPRRKVQQMEQILPKLVLARILTLTPNLIIYLEVLSITPEYWKLIKKPGICVLTFLNSNATPKPCLN